MVEDAAVDQNYEAFLELQPALEKTDYGRVALMYDGKLVGLYDDMGDAYSIGYEKFGLGRFTMQVIGQQPSELGSLAIAL